jgi:hypothetical protein
MRWRGCRLSVLSPSGPIVALALIAATTGFLVSPAALATAASGTPQVTRVVDVAGGSPFTGRRCNVATPYYTSPGGKEGEPSIAVNPRNPANRIAVWMDATRATVDTAYTTDGGRNWTVRIPPGLDGCTGNHQRPWEASGDPWLSFGPDGIAYLSTLSWAHFVTPPSSRYVSVIHVQTSHDGGRTWSRPTFLAGHRAVSDKPMVVANPHRPRVAYAIWRNQSFGLPVGNRGRTRLLFARTTDGGETWTRPIRIARGRLSDFFGSPQVSVLRGGALVATSSLANASGGTDLLAWRSVNRGSSWSGPTLIRTARAGANPAICGQAAAGGDTGSSSGQQAVVDGRSVVLVSLGGVAAAAGRGRIVLSRSDDGGRSWATRTVVRSRHPLLLSSIAASRSRLGLVWDQVDTSRVDCASMTIPTRTRFSTSSGLGSGWSTPVTVGSRWWNLASGARGSGGFSGYFVGDYQSLAAVPRGFTTITVQGRPLVGARPHPGVTGLTGVLAATILARG